MNNVMIPKNERKKILLIGDDLRFHSGVAGILRSTVIGTAHLFNYIVIGAAIKHPEEGQRLDLSIATNQEAGLTDSEVVLYPCNGYGTTELIRHLIQTEKPDALMMMTDPRYYTHLFQIENEIRKTMPIIYLNIWDGGGGSPMYNQAFYRSCDALLCISKQTEAVTKVALGQYKKDKIIKYTPHGINTKQFKPLDKNSKEINELKKELFGNKQYDFVLYFNSRNIRRKQIPDTMVAFRLFLDSLPKEQADKCVFLLHTQAIDDNGTDLLAVREALFGERLDQVVIDDKISDINRMNLLYNLADTTILLSSNEGWGLSTTESVMAGTMIIVNVTGGMQDQLRFEDENGDWIKHDEKFTTNNLGHYKKCGVWGIPVFPTSTSWQGSVQTPYVPDDRIDFRDATKAITEVYNLSVEERRERALKGREWMITDEARMSSDSMCDGIADAISDTIATFKPRKRFEVINVNKVPLKYIEYPVSF